MEFADVVKSGRTHLMDATPVTLGQEFGGYATQVRNAIGRLDKVLPELEELALGGTAVGTGINAPYGFAAAVIGLMAGTLRVSRSPRPATISKRREPRTPRSWPRAPSRPSRCQCSRSPTTFAGSAPDPPRGSAEIRLPDLQPGSSIMPGKVNPVMSEMVMQVAAQVVGNDATITWSAANGNFELNVMMPVLAHNLSESIALLANAARVFAERCVNGIEANEERARELVERNVMVVTALNPHIGYDAGAKVAKEALATGKSVREVVLEHGSDDGVRARPGPRPQEDDRGRGSLGVFVDLGDEPVVPADPDFDLDVATLELDPHFRRPLVVNLVSESGSRRHRFQPHLSGTVRHDHQTPLRRNRRLLPGGRGCSCGG